MGFGAASPVFSREAHTYQAATHAGCWDRLGQEQGRSVQTPEADLVCIWVCIPLLPLACGVALSE